MLTKKDLTNIVTGMLVANKEKTDQEKSELIIDFLDKENCLKVEKEEEDSYKYLIWRIIFTILAILSLSTYAYYLFNYILQLEQKDITYKYILSFCFIALVINIFLFIIGLIKGLKQCKKQQ